jgi:hypothetical protein
MRLGLSRRSTRELIATLMLAAFAVRALIPPGFMPAHDLAFALEICPDGFPAQLLGHGAHHHPPGSHAHSDHCVFGSAAAALPAARLANLGCVWRGPQQPVGRRESVAIVVQLIHLPQARGPPAAA